MPEGMFLRSGTDWHLDASGIDTFEAFIEDRGLSSADMDPVPIAVFLEYTAWFQARKHVSVRDLLVMGLERDDDGAFVASLNDGSQVSAEVVVAAPGIAYFRQFPEWATRLPEGVSAHTCDLVHFKELAGARVLVIGGRQSAYEWAALLGEHDVERVDVVHRHYGPALFRVSMEVPRPVHGRDDQSPEMVAFTVGHRARGDRQEGVAKSASPSAFGVVALRCAAD